MPRVFQTHIATHLVSQAIFQCYTAICCNKKSITTKGTSFCLVTSHTAAGSMDYKTFCTKTSNHVDVRHDTLDKEPGQNKSLCPVIFSRYDDTQTSPEAIAGDRK